jgi:hypothetical protein
VLSTGTDANGKAVMQTIKSSRYVTGVGSVARFTAIFSTPQANSQQLIGVFDDLDGWGFGFDGLQFGIFRRRSGVTTWTYQNNWNNNTFPGFDFSKGNVFEIKYQWLGYGMQTFSMEDSSGGLSVVHVIEYANLNTDTSILNPNLPIRAEVENTGNTSDITIESPSAVAGVEGFALSEAVSTNLAASGTVVGANGTSIPIISLFNPTTYQGQNNRLFVQATRLTLAAEGNKPCTFRVIGGGVPVGGAFSAISSDISPVETNTTLTSLTGGVDVGVYPVGKSDSIQVDLSAVRFLGFPGQYFTIVVDTDGATDVRVGVNFRQFL